MRVYWVEGSRFWDYPTLYTDYFTFRDGKNILNEFAFYLIVAFTGRVNLR